MLSASKNAIFVGWWQAMFNTVKKKLRDGPGPNSYKRDDDILDVRLYINIDSTYMYLYMHIYIYIRTYVYLYIFTCIYRYIYTICK